MPMPLRPTTTVWSCSLLSAALFLAISARDGPILWRAIMAEEKEAPVIPERATEATTVMTTVPLDEFELLPEFFCHRDPKELEDRELLLPLMNSLIVEG